jgi:pimeloyl-ACP methyl ester carboxylesterase
MRRTVMRPAVIIFVHGLWLTGGESMALRRRLEDALGAETHAFRYASRTMPMSEVTSRLERFARELAAPTMHFVGHSLGGLVLLRLFERFPTLPPGRVVFLGTPGVGSQAVTALARFGWASTLLGACVTDELMHPQVRRWTAARDLGVIAGSRPLGLGQFIARFNEPSDGTVAVSETRLPGVTDHLVLPVSHMGMLLSARVAQECAKFLRTGGFER